MQEKDDQRTRAIEELSRAISLLNETDLDQEMLDRGWTSELATFVATRMSECRSRIEGGWTPGGNYGGQWIRLMSDRIVGDDDLNRAIEEAARSVNLLAAKPGQSPVP
jgi:hypothetical protein